MRWVTKESVYTGKDSQGIPASSVQPTHRAITISAATFIKSVVHLMPEPLQIDVHVLSGDDGSAIGQLNTHTSS